MKIYIDLQTMKLVTAPGKKGEVKTIEVKRGDTAAVDLAFIDTSLVRSVNNAFDAEYNLAWPEGTSIRFCAKAKDDFDGEALVFSDDFTVTGPSTRAEGRALGYGKGVDAITVTNGGSGYTAAPDVIITSRDGNGSGAEATATITEGRVIGVQVLNGGYGYGGQPVIEFTGGGGTGATGEVVMDWTAGEVQSIRITDPGTGYTSAPSVVFKGGIREAKGVAVIGTGGAAGTIVGIDLQDGGAGYTSAPTVTITGDGTLAEATATVANGRVTGFTIDVAGSGYSEATVAIAGGGIKEAEATCTLSPIVLENVEVLMGGSGYPNSPVVTISGGGGTTDTSAVATVVGGRVTSVALPEVLTGYTSRPTVSITGSGTGATATAVFSPSYIAPPVIENPGSGYDHVPIVELNEPDFGAKAIVQNGRVERIVMPRFSFLGREQLTSYSISGGAGSGASIRPRFSRAFISAVEITNGGTGYGAPYGVAISGGGGSGAVARIATDEDGAVVRLDLVSAGSGYTSIPDVVVDAPAGGGVRAVFKARLNVKVAVRRITQGTGYTGLPAVVIEGGGGTGAAAAWPASASVNPGGSIFAKDLPRISGEGSGYHSSPAIAFADQAERDFWKTPRGTAIIAGAVIDIGGAGGSDYHASTYATIERTGMASVVVPCTVDGGVITGIDISYALSVGAFDDGRTTTRTVTITDPTSAGSGATATWNASACKVTGIRWQKPSGPETYTRRVLVVPSQGNRMLRPGERVFATNLNAFDGQSGDRFISPSDINVHLFTNPDTRAYVMPDGVSSINAPGVIPLEIRTQVIPTPTSNVVWMTLSPEVDPNMIAGEGFSSTPRVKVKLKNGAVVHATRYLDAWESRVVNGGSFGTYTAVDFGSVDEPITSIECEIISPTGTGAVFAAEVLPGNLWGFTKINGGSGYYSSPYVSHNGLIVAWLTSLNGVLSRPNLRAMDYRYVDGNSATVPLVVHGLGTGATAVGHVAQGHLLGFDVVSQGSGYEPLSNIEISGDGSGATARAVVVDGSIRSISIVDQGSGYTYANVVIPPPFHRNGIAAVATCRVFEGGVSAINITNQGAGYGEVPLVFSGGGGSGAIGVAYSRDGSIVSARLTSAGSGYTSVPSISVGGTGAGALVKLTTAERSVASIELTDPGEGYEQSDPIVSFSGSSDDNNASGEVVVTEGRVTGVVMHDQGRGYEEAPSVLISDKYGIEAEVAMSFEPRKVSAITVTDPGSGYTTAPQVSFSSGDAQAVSSLSTIGRVTGIEMTDAGAGYVSAPAVTLSEPNPLPIAPANTGTTPIVSTEIPRDNNLLDRWRPARIRVHHGSKSSGFPAASSVSRVEILDAGAGYASTIPEMNYGIMTSGISTMYHAKLRFVLSDGALVKVVVVSPGYVGHPSAGYFDITLLDPTPSVIPTGVGGTSTNTTSTTSGTTSNRPVARKAVVKAVLLEGSVANVAILDQGAGYDTEPTVTFADPPPGYTGRVSLNGEGLKTLLGSGAAPDVRSVDLDAEFEIRAPAPALAADYSVTNNVVTVTTGDPHMLATGDPVNITVLTGEAPSRTEIAVEVESPDTFTIPLTTGDTTGTCSVVPVRVISTKTVTLRVHNDVVKGSETAPA